MSGSVKWQIIFQGLIYAIILPAAKCKIWVHAHTTPEKFEKAFSLWKGFIFLKIHAEEISKKVTMTSYNAGPVHSLTAESSLPSSTPGGLLLSEGDDTKWLSKIGLL